MNEFEANRQAKTLVGRMGAQEAWRMLTARAIEHHIAGEIAAREDVQQVLAALHRLAGPRAESHPDDD